MRYCPRNDNAHSLRMIGSLNAVCGETAAADFAERFPLFKSADINKKFDWAQSVCDYLDERFDTDAISDIRRRCSCSDGRSIAAKMKKYFSKSESISEFVTLFNAGESFASLEYISETRLIFCYPECYCACVKHVDRQLSASWCACTLGNAEGIFSTLFGKDVSVRLIESIKTGGIRCAIEIAF